MDPVQTPSVTPTPPPTSSAGVFGTKIPASVAFLLAILLFLLPFAEIRCNGTPIANNTGLGLAIGSQWKEVVANSLFGNGINETNPGDEEKFKKQDANMFAAAALGLAIIGLLIAFLAPGGGGKMNMIIAILGAVSLIALILDLRSKLKGDGVMKPADVSFGGNPVLSVDGTPAFYLAIVLFILGAVFSWQRSKAKP